MIFERVDLGQIAAMTGFALSFLVILAILMS